MLKLLAIQSDMSFDVLKTIWFISAMNIGLRIRQLRKSKHLTQDKLGELVGRSQQEIYRWEKGLVRVHVEDLGKLAVVFGVDVKAFYDENECSGEHVDWELQAAASPMTAKQRQKLIDLINAMSEKDDGPPPEQRRPNPPAPF
jgi:transcriptional regulator with XRE-family HTH domain